MNLPFVFGYVIPEWSKVVVLVIPEGPCWGKFKKSAGHPLLHISTGKAVNILSSINQAYRGLWDAQFTSCLHQNLRIFIDGQEP